MAIVNGFVVDNVAVMAAIVAQMAHLCKVEKLVISA